MTSPLSDELALGIEACADRSWDVVFVHCTPVLSSTGPDEYYQCTEAQ